MFKGPHWKTKDFQDLLCLMFQLIRIARSNPVELDQHIEDPGASSIFGVYPRILADSEAVALICDTLRSASMNYDDPHQVEEVLTKRIEKTLRRGAALGAHAADDGRRPAGARHRRGRARRHQDDGLDRPAAGDPRQDDRRRAGRHLPRRVSRLRHRRAVRDPGEGGDRRGPALLQPDPRGDGGGAAQPRPEHLRRGRAAEHARPTCGPPTTSSKGALRASKQSLAA